MPAVRTLDAYLEASARRFPDRPAAIDSLGRRMTYRQLNQRANQVANLLVAHGVGPGDRVGVCLPKSVEAVAGIFGILKAQAAYVPVDFTAPTERNRFIFGNCQVKAALLHPPCADVFQFDAEIGAPSRPAGSAGASPSPAVVLVGVDVLPDGLPDGPQWLAGRSVDDQLTAFTTAAPPDPEALAYILYTSGSTGLPKGVMLSHRNATSFVNWCSEVFGPTPEDRFSSHAPFHFDLSILDLYLPIKHGAMLCVLSEEISKEPMKLGRFIAENRLTCWYSVPSILALMAQYGALRDHDCGCLRLVLFAGEVFPIKHLRRLKELWPRPVYYNLYGPTETNVCTYYRIPDTIPPDRDEPYPIGQVCSHCEAVVLGEDLQPVGDGEEGVLYVAGEPVMRGYWGAPARDAEAFVEREGRRFYNTGDVVRLDENGAYLFLGRKDRMIKRRGYRIELGEIEAGVYRHLEVREVAALAFQGEEGATIEVVLVARGEKRPSIIELKQHCARVLPAYMNPDRFTFVERLPRTSTDKIDYQSLLKLRKTR